MVGSVVRISCGAISKRSGVCAPDQDAGPQRRRPHCDLEFGKIGEHLERRGRGKGGGDECPEAQSSQSGGKQRFHDVRTVAADAAGLTGNSRKAAVATQTLQAPAAKRGCGQNGLSVGSNHPRQLAAHPIDRQQEEDAAGPPRVGPEADALFQRLRLGQQRDLLDDLGQLGVGGLLLEDVQRAQQRQARVDHRGELSREDGELLELDLLAQLRELDRGVQAAGNRLGLHKLGADGVGGFGQVADAGAGLLADPVRQREQARGLRMLGCGIAQQDGLGAQIQIFL